MNLIQYFERKAKGKIVQELEGLRFLAIVPVVIQHCVERWYRNAYTPGSSALGDSLINYALGGGVGVYLFYAISGFILPLPFAIKRLSDKPMGSLKTYFMRRLTRLEPPYILVMLLLAISAIVLHKLSTAESLGYFFTGITYSSTLVYKHFNTLNPVIWSLEVEIQFYIVAPFITYFIFGIKKFAHRNIVIVAIILFMIFMQEQTGISNGFNVLRYTILGQLQYFMVGILMVNLYLEEKLKPGSYTWVWDVAATIAIFSMIGFRWVTGFGKTVLFVIALVTLFVGAFRSGAFNRFMKRPWIMAIGGMCYSIYLLHLAIAQASIELLLRLVPGAPNSLAWFFVYIGFFMLCLLLIVPVFYLLVEKPCMDHSWPTQLKNFIKSKTGWGLSLEETGAKTKVADKV
ncbi:MAG TPA: acyltransferase [Chitinophagaceae bacterium]|nr:acyltransferase [Chitinophagaceae bacterium]